MPAANMGNSRIKIIKTIFEKVSRLEFITSVIANMSRMIEAIPNSDVNIFVKSPFALMKAAGLSTRSRPLQLTSDIIGKFDKRMKSASDCSRLWLILTHASRRPYNAGRRISFFYSTGSDFNDAFKGPLLCSISADSHLPFLDHVAARL